jgi:hypothetical protein
MPDNGQTDHIGRERVPHLRCRLPSVMLLADSALYRGMGTSPGYVVVRDG